MVKKYLNKICWEIAFYARFNCNIKENELIVCKFIGRILEK